jgi:8-oxo-dGTP pyrophosphatase MutT (NUDIX family)
VTVRAADDPIAAALARVAPGSSDFDLNPGKDPVGARQLRQAAVLIALVPGRGGADVVLTKRSSRLEHHPGQIALPGGKVDPQDAGPEAAALREAQEEVGLDPAAVTVLGRMPAHETVTGFSITPVVGRLRAPFTPVPEDAEVDEVFFVPLAHLAEPGRYRVERRMWRGVWRNYYVVPWGPYYIWGATARILRALAERLRA